MHSDRTAARVVGALLLVAFAGAGTAALSKPILDAPDFLVRIAAHPDRITAAALLQLVMAAACAGIGIALYPVLRRHGEALALGAAGFRLIEATFQIAGAVGLLSLVTVAQELMRAGARDAAALRIAGALLLAGSAWVNHVAVVFAWCLGALLYYVAFHRRRLLPRWLTAWGIAGAALALSTSVLVAFRAIAPMGPVQNALMLPIASQELTMAVWLVVKGFQPIASGLAARASLP